MTPSREIRLRALLVLGSLLAGVLLLEGALRLVRSGRGAGKEAGETARYTEHDPLLGWRKKAGARVTYRRREYTVEVAINSRGLRDPERDYGAPGETLTVLALGDSFLEGYTVPLQQTVTQVLEEQLRRTGPARVVNGGSAGYSTDQEYLFWQEEGYRYRPRVVVLFFFYNDIVYNDRQEYFGAPKPVLEMAGGRLCLHRYPVRQPAPAVPTREGEPDSGSALLGWVKERLWYGAPRAHDALAGLGLWKPIPKLPVRLELRTYERRLIPEIEDAWAKTDLILATLAREVETAGAHFLVAGIPSRLELDERTWSLTRQLYGVDDATWNRRQVLERLADSGRRGGFPVLDLSEALRAANGTRSPTYFTYDGHWTALGHRVAAEQVGAFLERQGWLVRGEGPARGSAP